MGWHKQSTFFLARTLGEGREDIVAAVSYIPPISFFRSMFEEEGAEKKQGEEERTTGGGGREGVRTAVPSYHQEVAG